MCKLHQQIVEKKSEKSHQNNSGASNRGLQSTGWIDDLGI